MKFENLTKENFFNDMMEKYPKAMKSFCSFVDEYKERIGWDELFNGAYVDPYNTDSKAIVPKYHDLPLEMQIGIFMVWVATVNCEQDEAFTIAKELVEDELKEIEELEKQILTDKIQDYRDRVNSHKSGR